MREGVVAMNQEFMDRRSAFRFPVVIPVEYFKPDDSGIQSYALDLTKNGTFISSDDPLNIGSKLSMRLNIPLTMESSKIHPAEGVVVWNKIRPFKSTRNGMGVKFIETLPVNLLIHALEDNTKKLIKETETKKLLQERFEKLESELEEAKRLVSLGRCVEKIIFELSNPILTLSGQLEIIKTKMNEHKRMLEAHEGSNKKEFKRIIKEFVDCCKQVDEILRDYEIISELAHIVGDNKETLETKLKRYNC